MNRFGFLVCAFAAFLVVAVGCGGGSGDGVTTTPPGTAVTLSASPTSTTTGSPVQFTVHASNSGIVLNSISIDYTSDGTWDDEQTFDQSSISWTFTHTYVSAGSYTIRAEVKDANNVPTTKTVGVSISAPLLEPVAYTLSAFCGASGTNEPCYSYSVGPLDPGGSLGRVETALKSLGDFQHGASVSLTNAFQQDRWTTGPVLLPCGCNFSLNIYAGTPGSVTKIVTGTCRTQASATVNDPSLLTCTTTANGTVP
jgi:PKD domain